MGYYIGDGKKLFQITRIIENPNIDESNKQMILDEYYKISNSSQSLASFILDLDSTYDKLKSHANLIDGTFGNKK